MASNSLSTLTWGDAASKVARMVNGQDDADQVAIAKEHITDVFKEWNARRRWKFLLTLASNITVTANTAAYDLPSLFKKAYAAYLTTSKRWLSYINERDYIRSGGPFLTPGVTDGYYLSNAATTGTITIVPTPTTNDILKVWYYRRMAETGSDATTLDILTDYEGFLLDAARARMIADKGPIEKLGFWTAQAREGYKLVVADDESQPDADVGFSLEPTYFSKFEDYNAS